MKAHITSAVKPLALFYGLDEKTQTELAGILDETGVAGREIMPAQLNQSVGVLAGLGGRAEPDFSGEAPDTQLLLLSELERGPLNRILDLLRERKIVIPLKAVVTKHNKTWSVLELLQELQREHEAVQQYEQKEGAEK